MSWTEKLSSSDDAVDRSANESLFEGTGLGIELACAYATRACAIVRSTAAREWAADAVFSSSGDASFLLVRSRVRRSLLAVSATVA